LGHRDQPDDEGGEAAPPIVAPGALTALLGEVARSPTEGAPHLLPGHRAGRYSVIRAIGHGGFGTVYEAHDTVLNRLVALKTLHTTTSPHPNAAREGEAAARLAHPNIAAVYDAGLLEGGTPYLIYEMLHGETVESRLARGPVAPREALDIAIPIARALEHAHGHGVVHRDLKPANVFLTADGDVKVLDFGVALLFGQGTARGGTPSYMAPEQRRGGPEDGRTDLYALGLLLREMLTPPQASAVDGGSLPHVIEKIVSALLAPDPTARPRSARAVVHTLEAARRALAPSHARRWNAVMLLAAALGLAAALVATLIGRDRPSIPSAPSIAVMPFADMSSQRDQEYFSDGIAEEILNALSRVDGLRVVGRTSAFSFKGKHEDIREIGRKLDVRAVLEGSVRKSGNRVRVSAQLISTEDGYRLWSESYDRELSDVFAVQSDIARSVATALQVELLQHERAMPEVYATRNSQAYDEYLLGRQLLQRGSHASLQQAVEALRRAVSLDPTYGPAWAALSLAVLSRGWLELDASAWAAARGEARSTAESAIRVAPHLPEGYVSRAAVRVYDWDWSGAQADIDRASASDPRNPELLTVIVRKALAFGDADAAVSAARRMAENDPLNPRAWNSLGVAHVAAGQTDLAGRAYTRTLALNPEYLVATLNVVVLDVVTGRYEDALAGCTRLRTRARDAGSVRVYTRACLITEAIAHHELGHPRQSDEALERLIASFPTAAEPIAEVYAWRGQKDEAFAWLERAVDAHDQYAGSLKTRPALQRIRGDPRFAELLRRVGVPE
jgi:TolB-like protein/Tfp pilus assembly protein PilF